jgi:hypothetical protein
MTLSAFRPGTVKVLLINIVPGRISTATLLHNSGIGDGDRKA